MNKRKYLFIVTIVLVTAWLAAACGAFNPTAAPTALPPVRLTAAPTFPPTQPPRPTASATLPAPSPTPFEPPKQAVLDFFAALAAGDYDGAAALYSNFSLMVDGVTRGEAAAGLKARQGKIASWKIVEIRAFDDRTSLVHVAYLGDSLSGGGAPAPTAAPRPTETLATGKVARTMQAELQQTATAIASTPAAEQPVSVDEWWPVRLENGQWRINRGGLIDFQTLDVPAQTTAGLTVKPRQITRYSDHLTLTLLVQNQTGEAIVLGQPNEVMATFHFGDQPVEAEQTRLIFAGHQSYPNTAIQLKGLYETYPDGVTIRKWKSIKEKPWFEFKFQ